MFCLKKKALSTRRHTKINNFYFFGKSWQLITIKKWNTDEPIWPKTCTEPKKNFILNELKTEVLFWFVQSELKNEIIYNFAHLHLTKSNRLHWRKILI